MDLVPNCRGNGFQKVDKQSGKGPTDPKKNLFSQQSGKNNELKLDGELTLETKNMVLVVYFIGIGILILVATAEPMVLLYQKYVGFVSRGKVKFYVQTTVIQSTIEVLGGALMGILAVLVEPPRAITICTVLIAVGSFSMAAAPPNKIGYLFGFALFSLCSCTSVARTLMLTENVPAKNRTAVMSFHELMSPIGRLLGPLLWLACDQFRADINLFGGLRLHKYSLNYQIASLLSLIVELQIRTFLCFVLISFA